MEGAVGKESDPIDKYTSWTDLLGFGELWTSYPCLYVSNCSAQELDWTIVPRRVGWGGCSQTQGILVDLFHSDRAKVRSY